MMPFPDSSGYDDDDDGCVDDQYDYDDSDNDGCVDDENLGATATQFLDPSCQMIISTDPN